MLPKILCVVGTRPEVVKMAPVAFALLRSHKWDVRILATAQHREMLDQVMGMFGLVADLDLDAMRPNQALPDLTSRLMTGMDECLKEHRPQLVLAQGDTTHGAGVRVGELLSQDTVRPCRGGLADTRSRLPMARRDESGGDRAPGIHQLRPHEDGARQPAARGRRRREHPRDGKHRDRCAPHGGGEELSPARRRASGPPDDSRHGPSKGELRGADGVDMARRSESLRGNTPICTSCFPYTRTRTCSKSSSEDWAHCIRSHCAIRSATNAFVTAMKRAYLILTDSGGVQEEAPALAKPVLVLRDETERPEAVLEGVAELVGTDMQRIVDRVSTLLDDEDAYRKMARGSSPYGDGKAAERIARCIDAFFRSRPGKRCG